MDKVSVLDLRNGSDAWAAKPTGDGTRSDRQPMCHESRRRRVTESEEQVRSFGYRHVRQAVKDAADPRGVRPVVVPASKRRRVEQHQRRHRTVTLLHGPTGSAAGG